jgi:alpha-L-arabinofuranosidase
MTEQWEGPESRRPGVARLTTGGGIVGDISPRLFGSFVEHLGRCVYEGIYEPGHPTSDEHGFRGDVADLVRELGVTAVRYPGGNFVSGYRWEDGIGDPESRPRRLDLAWHCTETNEVGVDEFLGWCARTGLEAMLAVNLGTRGLEQALDLLEYVNHPGGTRWSDLRAEHGSPAPYDVRIWCLGNEMDGPWQLGHTTADDYGRLASRTAAAMKAYDPGLELVVCGSSSSGMPTFGSWERTVLQHCFEHVDLISCHAYYMPRADDLPSFLASAVDMDRFIETVAAICDEVAATLGSTKQIGISFDEWNVWYQGAGPSQRPEGWPVAPALQEDEHTMTDAVVVGSLLISLLRHCDRVRAACQAQLVNVIAPIRTEAGGRAWKQTIFEPFALTARLARGQVIAHTLETRTLTTRVHGEVPAVDAVVTRDPDDGTVGVFVVNRVADDEMELLLDLRAVGAVSVAESHVVSRDDQRKPATWEQEGDGMLRVHLPPVSWTAVRLRVESP